MVRVFMKVFVILCVATSAFAQTKPGAASLAGSVQDPDGRAIQNAVIVTRNLVTNTSGTAITDASGKFAVDGLTAGKYDVEVTAAGFALNVRNNVVIAAGKSEPLTFTLAVGAINEQVDV